MNDIQIFNNPDFGDIRTVMIDGEPWLVGADVSKVLGYKDNVSAMRNVDNEDKVKGCSISTPSRGTQRVTVINESGLYSLIFGSKLESAKKFKRWVTSEVLPSLRKTGSYGTKQLPMSTEEKIQLLAQGNVELNEKIDGVRADLEALKMDLPILPIEADKITIQVKKKGVNVLGGKDSNAYNDRSLRQKIYNDLYSNLKYNFGVKSYKAIRRSEIDKALDIIKKYEPPYFLAQEIVNCNAQSKFDFM